jgi:hypothetical protein
MALQALWAGFRFLPVGNKSDKSRASGGDRPRRMPHQRPCRR